MAWDLVVTREYKTNHYMKWKVVCTSDGAALTATDLVALMPEQLKNQPQLLMLMKVSPGTGGVVPDNTFTITLTDEEGDELWSKAAISNVAVSWHSMSEDIGAYIPLFSELNLAFDDIGTSGDQVTLYFISWLEEM